MDLPTLYKPKFLFGPGNPSFFTVFVRILMAFLMWLHSHNVAKYCKVEINAHFKQKPQFEQLLSW